MIKIGIFAYKKNISNNSTVSAISYEEHEMAQTIIDILESEKSAETVMDLVFARAEEDTEDYYLPEEEKPPKPEQYTPKYNDMQNNT